MKLRARLRRSVRHEESTCPGARATPATPQPPRPLHRSRTLRQQPVETRITALQPGVYTTRALVHHGKPVVIRGPAMLVWGPPPEKRKLSDECPGSSGTTKRNLLESLHAGRLRLNSGLTVVLIVGPIHKLGATTQVTACQQGTASPLKTVHGGHAGSAVGPPSPAD